MSVGRAAAAVNRGAELLAAALRSGRRIVFFGAGSSGRLAVMEAAELWPTFRVKAAAAIAGGARAVLRSVEGAEDDAGAGRKAAARLGPGDVAVGATASGVTRWVEGALREARRRGAGTILVTCHPRPPIRADVVVSLQTGAEPLAGSTRMNAGTATKVALNTMTTTAMAKIGKTWRNRMVDVLATNRKLRDRAARLVADLGGSTHPRARALLRQGGSVKAAIVMARLGCGSAEARTRLAAARGALAPILGR